MAPEGAADLNPPFMDHILEWLEGSVTYSPTFLDDNSDDYQWLESNQPVNHQDPAYAGANSFTTTITAEASRTTTPTTTPLNPLSPNHHRLKRKSLEEATPDQNVPCSQKAARPAKRSLALRKGAGKTVGRDSSNDSDKDGRWAEQLLNPCAAAVTAGDVSRVQHFLCVIHELASPTGDPNHRLAFHGLRALRHHLSPNFMYTATSTTTEAVATFASSEPSFFRRSILNFNDHSPWFSLPSNVANSSILQLLRGLAPDKSRSLHIVDIGVSHGAQWPMLLDSLSRRQGGPPRLIRLTIVSASSESDAGMPFSVGPAGYDYCRLLLDFAKKININLQINRLNDHPLQSLTSNAIRTTPGETLIVSTQFRLHYLNHNVPDERTRFLKALRSLEPEGVILSENNSCCSCAGCADFATGFSRRVEYLWRFLDSANATYKGRESNERRMMEGEAAKALFNRADMNEGKGKWFERMHGAGFSGEAFGEDAIEAARALLRKHDSNWEMRTEENDGSLSLWWKGQPVSFCSLWKLGG
ncbi:hypothetical protein SAY86_031410 [Trapa natans]|uniref:Nodulation-signaling pathway 1 protein n=1 Tax=Trapa natans TaxID=22666 RepID=A0AAN7R5V3_TRANT|nr:hypothetical protein SAY86_031410 [Trapa natans]